METSAILRGTATFITRFRTSRAAKSFSRGTITSTGATLPYLGLGPSAHSFRDGRRWWNVRSVESYCRLLERGKSPVEDSETLTDDEIALETLYLGFRTRDGVPLETLRRYRGWERALETLRGNRW